MENQIVLEGWQIVAMIAASGGLSIALLCSVLVAILRSPAIVTALENLAKNVDPEQATRFVLIGQGLQAGGKLVEEVFDGKPLLEKDTAKS